MQGETLTLPEAWYFRRQRHHILGSDIYLQANFPNLRRLFIEARTDAEEREVSRRAVSEACCVISGPIANPMVQFYNAVLFMGSVAVFSLLAQKLNAGK